MQSSFRRGGAVEPSCRPDDQAEVTYSIVMVGIGASLF